MSDETTTDVVEEVVATEPTTEAPTEEAAA